MKLQGETASADEKTTARYPEVLVKAINKGDYSKQQVFMQTKYPSIGRCYLGFS